MNKSTSTLKPEMHSNFYWAFSDSITMIRRNLTHIVNNMDQLLSVIIQPIMFMLLFRYVFGGAINTGGTTYVNFLVAGILVQSAAFGATTTSLGVATDLTKGIMDRFRSLPMLSAAMLIGHTTADLVRNFISSLIMVGVAFAVGFRPEANFTEWLVIVGILMLFTYAFSWLSAILGLVAKSIEAVQWFGFVLIFPLTFASSAFVPTNGMPKYLRIFAENQPVTHVIETIRGLMTNTPIGDHGWLALFWCLGILIFSILIASTLFRKLGR